MKLPVRFPTLALGIILSVLLLTLTACREEDPEGTTEVPSDEEITNTIRAQLKNADNVSAENIDVSTQDGVPTLTGTTDNLLAKIQASEISQSVRGVLSVVNNIKVTVNRPDQALDRDIDQAISSDPVTENWELATTVNNGFVTLKGMVDSWQERRLVETIVRGVRGVKGIDNNIIVSYDKNRPDREIQSEIEQTLMMDSRIDDNRISVAVKEGNVMLSGSVGSALEKNLAVREAHIAGVDSVSADNLEVHPEYASRLLVNEQLTTLTSGQIKETIERALTYDPRVPESEIDVAVDDGVVTLKGTVENLNSKISAGQDALHTAGVNTINNNIEVERKVVVRPKIPTSDKAIKSRIREAIIRNPYVEKTAVDINIMVEKGIVKLKGEVDSQFKKSQVEEVASNVKGVIAINNNLDVSDDSQS